MTRNEKTLLTFILLAIMIVMSFIAYMVISSNARVASLRVYNGKSLDEIEDEEPDYESEYKLMEKKFLENVAYLEVVKVHNSIEKDILEIKNKGNTQKLSEIKYSIEHILREYFSYWNEEIAKKVLTEMYDGYKEDDVDYLMGLTSHEGKIKFMIEYEIRFLKNQGLQIIE